MCIGDSLVVEWLAFDAPVLVVEADAFVVVDRVPALAPLATEELDPPPRRWSARVVATWAAAISDWYPPSFPAFRSACAFEKSVAASASSARALETEVEDDLPEEGGGADGAIGALGVVVRTPPVLLRVVPSKAFNVEPSVRPIRTSEPSTAMTYFSSGWGIVFEMT